MQISQHPRMCTPSSAHSQLITTLHLSYSSSRSTYNACVCGSVHGDRSLPLCLSHNPPSEGKCAKHRLHSPCNLQGHRRQQTHKHICKHTQAEVGWPPLSSDNSKSILLIYANIHRFCVERVKIMMMKLTTPPPLTLSTRWPSARLIIAFIQSMLMSPPAVGTGWRLFWEHVHTH